ncbi:hypothetical protein SAMN05444166_6911 [Singulisphaera sp. GP187]|nr:hypothetical protein SAMN05444166_6911 [Singulisphaera sp. GP187]
MGSLEVWNEWVSHEVAAMVVSVAFRRTDVGSGEFRKCGEWDDQSKAVPSRTYPCGVRDHGFACSFF